jgi:putative FmdB family regulatory protein
MVVPTYEYECPKCPRVFEVKQRITEPKLEICEICGGPIHRLLSATPFILKGGGWYVTDYPSESRKKASKSESTSGDSAPATPTPSAEKSSTSEPAPSQSEKAKSSEKARSSEKAKSSDKGKTEPAAKPKPSDSSPSSTS